MIRISKDEYLKNPCRASSIPYWKSTFLSVPENMRIVHDDDFTPALLNCYSDEPYFRLFHSLQNLKQPVPPAGFSICEASVHAFLKHICACYGSACLNERDMDAYIEREVYCSSLWVAVRDDHSNQVVATGIAELDFQIGEGILEWIQVSDGYRGRGLGRFIVAEILWRMKEIARFATVSGQCNNPTNPEGLYRKCGFTGEDVWHILSRK